MAGKLCTGQKENNIGAARIENSKAYCEGLQWRANGTAVAYPISSNPHVAGSDAADAWDRGWTVTNAATGGQVSKADAPCCSTPQNTIAA